MRKYRREKKRNYIAIRGKDIVMNKKTYEELTMEILLLESEVWFATTVPSPDYREEGETEGDFGWN